MLFLNKIAKKTPDESEVWTYMSRLLGADIDLSSLRLGHSNGLLKERFLNMALTKI